MRDKNLSYSQFNIQLMKTLKKEISDFNQFFRRAVVVSPTLSLESYYFRYPKDFRLLRALAIIQWYFPEEFHWRIYLDLTEKSHSQLSSKQRIELSLLLSSEDNCKKFLFETKRYSSNEIFGNILKNDMQDLLKNLKISKRNLKVKRTQRRRGYNDKGSRKPDWKWLPTQDFSFTEYQNMKERKLNQELKTKQLLQKYLRELEFD